MKFKSIILSFLIGISVSVCAQENKNEPSTQRAKSVYAELGGNGVEFSANYDTRFAKSQNGFGARAGVGFVAALGESVITFPLGINYLLGKRSSYLEAGLGITIANISAGDDFLGTHISSTTTSFIVPGLGYRYQPMHNGFTGRIFISPLITKGDALFWAGLSLGYKF